MHPSALRKKGLPLGLAKFDFQYNNRGAHGVSDAMRFQSGACQDRREAAHVPGLTMARVIATNPLARGFYTVPEAARLIQVGSTQRIYGWLRGYPGRNTGPLLQRDYAPIGEQEELSFLDLMEVRFVEHFRESGVKARALRIAAEKLRKKYKQDHPFALEHVLLVADRADIYVIEAMKDGARVADDRRLWSLLTDNYVMYEAIKASLLPGVEFDPKSRLARRWHPTPDAFPRVTLDPRIGYGQPALPSGIPTRTIYDAFKAEHGNVDAVVHWFGIPSPEVLEAVRFEEFLDQRRQKKAA